MKRRLVLRTETCPHGVRIGILILALLPAAFPSCSPDGGEAGGGAGARKGPASAPSADSGDSRKTPVIVGVDLEKLPGEAGEFFRNRKARRENRRRNQEWLRPADLDLGEVRKGTIAVGKFRFRNPTGKKRVLKSIASSCACQKLFLRLGGKRIEIEKGKTLDIPLPPDAEGVLEAHVNVSDVGEKLAEILVTTDDPDDPVITLRVRAVGVDDFLVTIEGKRQNSVWLGNLSTHSSKDFEVDVRSRDGKPFEILGVGPRPPKLELSYAPVEGDPSHWRIRGKAGPGMPEGGWGGTLLFDTDRGSKVELLLQAVVEPPVVVEPLFLPLGSIPARSGKKGSVRVRAGDPRDSFVIEGVDLLEVKLGRKPLSARGLEGGGPKAEFRAESGTEAEILLVVPPGLPRGRLEGKLRIRFAGGRPGSRTVSFVGFVR